MERLLPTALADMHRDLQRCSLESEFLAQLALQESPIAGLEESGGEDDETRRARGCLGGKEDARLLAAT